jgi:hypothetical protein
MKWNNLGDLTAMNVLAAIIGAILFIAPWAFGFEWRRRRRRVLRNMSGTSGGWGGDLDRNPGLREHPDTPPRPMTPY